MKNIYDLASLDLVPIRFRDQVFELLKDRERSLNRIGASYNFETNGLVVVESPEEITGSLAAEFEQAIHQEHFLVLGFGGASGLVYVGNRTYVVDYSIIQGFLDRASGLLAA